QRVLVVRFDLEDFLVERAGLGHLAFVAQVVRDLDELLDGLVGLPRARVHVAERVLRGPVLRLVLDDAHVLRDGGVEFPLPDQLLSIPKRGGAIDWHLFNQSYQTALEGGTIACARRSSQTAQRRPDDRRSRSLCGDRIRSAGRVRANRASAGRASPSRRSTPRQWPSSAGRRAGRRAGPSAGRARGTRRRGRYPE